MDQVQINSRLAIIKYLYALGCDTLSAGNSITKAACVLHFHDSVESLFFLIAELFDIGKTRINFMDYFDEIKKADADKKDRELTHKIQLGKLNDLRVGFKHKGTLPNENECENLRISIYDFFQENIIKFCGIDFDKISLANSIQDSQVRSLMQEADDLLKNKNYSECLAKLGLAFYMLFHKTQKKTRTVWGESAVFLAPSIDFSRSDMFQRDLERIINPAYEPVAEALNIMILGIDYKNYAKFQCLTPSFVTMMDGSIRECEGRGEFKTRFNINRRNAESCYFFVIDAALKIERFDFGLISSWVKPDKVTIIDEEGVIRYVQSGQEFKPNGNIGKGTIINFTGAGTDRPEGKFQEVRTDSIAGWVKMPIKTKNIDHPELKKEDI